MVNAAVLVSGGGTNLQALLDAQAAGRMPHVRIALVVASNPQAYALQRAAKAGVEAVVCARKAYESASAHDAALCGLLQSHGIDMVVLAGYLSMIGPRVLAAYPDKILNIHPSLIPSFCGDGFYGLKVHEEVLRRGVKVTGATVHFVDHGTDTGPIILQKAVSVQQGDTPEILQKRVMEQAEWKLLPEAVRLFTEDRLVIQNHTVWIKEEESR